MAHKRKADQTKLILDTALKLADSDGWETLDLKKIARRAKIKPASIEEKFDDIWDILASVLMRLEKQTKEEVADYLSDHWRDNLTEILMARFDLAQAHRGAFLSLLPAARNNPQMLRRFAPLFYRTMKNMLVLAKAPRAWRLPPGVSSFGLAYLSCVYAWAQDDTKDLSKTMAVIDKRLDLIERLTGHLPCHKTR